MKKLFWGVVFVLFSCWLAAGIFVAHRHYLAWRAEKDAPREVAVAKPKPTPPPKFTAPPWQPGELEKLGLVIQPLSCDEKNCRGKIAVHNEKSVNIADLEGVRLDVALSEKPQFLFSLEAPYPGSRYPAQVKALKAEEVFRDFTFDFTLARPKQPEVLGLYLCKDSDGVKHCNGKPAVSVLGVIQDAIHASRTNPKYVAPDKTYIFQMLLVTPDGRAAWFAKANDESTKRYSALEKFLSKFVDPTARGELAQRMFYTTKNTEILVSMTLKPEGEHLMLRFPYNGTGFLYHMVPSPLVARIPKSLLPPKN